MPEEQTLRSRNRIEGAPLLLTHGSKKADASANATSVPHQLCLKDVVLLWLDLSRQKTASLRRIGTPGVSRPVVPKRAALAKDFCNPTTHQSPLRIGLQMLPYLFKACLGSASRADDVQQFALYILLRSQRYRFNSKLKLDHERPQRVSSKNPARRRLLTYSLIGSLKFFINEIHRPPMARVSNLQINPALSLPDEHSCDYCKCRKDRLCPRCLNDQSVLLSEVSWVQKNPITRKPSDQHQKSRQSNGSCYPTRLPHSSPLCSVRKSHGQVSALRASEYSVTVRCIL